ncbi:MAG TPA: choice-of-anchor Q domain-containing protein, partial [Actinomycetota bacterium]|nr:choice-of-anchor Q domain-containing protein [Actinomycetota bacterium]
TIESTDAGALVANLVGNTIDRSAAEGLEVDSQGPAEGHVTVNAFDDVYARVAHAPIFLDATVDSTLTFRAGRGDFFANGDPNVLAGNSVGTGNLNANPAFVGEPTGNLALKATSALVDAGAVCTPGGLADLDAAGHGRLFGSSVDIGAFERGAGAPTGKAFVGTPVSDAFDGTTGADIMCGYGGDDILLGKGGADWLDGGMGDDSLIGGPGPDRLFGGAGNDLCLSAVDGVHGNDSVDGGPGTDRFTADPGDHLTNVEHRGGCDA